MFHRKLIIGLMIAILFCVPSFTAQGSTTLTDDSVFNIDTPILTATAQTADLQENPTAGIVLSFTNDSLNLKTNGSDADIIANSRGSDNSCSIRAVANLSTVGTYEELFTILNTGDFKNIDPNRTSVAGNLATNKNDNGIRSLENSAANLNKNGRKETAAIKSLDSSAAILNTKVRKPLWDDIKNSTLKSNLAENNN